MSEILIQLTNMRLMQADVESATGTRPSAGAVAEALRNMTGHRLDANVYHFGYRTDLTDALCSCAGIDLSREAMTKSQVNKVMSVVKKPRNQAVALQETSLEKRSFPQLA